MQAGYSITTPLLAYRNVNWSDPSFTDDADRCNAFKHPSREGTYFKMSIHPLESVFIKTSWTTGDEKKYPDGVARVRPAEMKAYSRWELSGPP